MSKKTLLGDPAYWMLSDGVESTPVVFSPACDICMDPEYALMGLPLCRACPVCGGHVKADETRCDVCGLNDWAFHNVEIDLLTAGNLFEIDTVAGMLLWAYSDEDNNRVLPTGEHLMDAIEVIIQNILALLKTPAVGSTSRR